MSRKKAREVAFQCIYEYCTTLSENELTLELLSHDEDLHANDVAYYTACYRGVIENYDAFCEQLSVLSQDFKVQRIFKVDLAILLLAMFELKCMPDVPQKVAINEAVELAKAFSTQKSPAFVNGILGSIVKQANGEENV